FKYYKKGRVKFLSHLNTIEVFKRAFTAAEIPVCYSMGYKKKPRFSFAPPLPYGITGENELFDVLIVAGSGVDIQRINTFLPEGLKVKGYERQEGTKSTLNKEITKALYRFSSDVIRTEQKCIQEFMSRDRVDVEIEKKGRRVVKNLRELVLRIEVKEMCFEALLLMEPGRTCRPADLIQALYPGMDLMDFNPVRLLLE
ncbi:MAG: TIGR03936 family radical SAM-associated protein, partial [Chitinivibrionales bacterium]